MKNLSSKAVRPKNSEDSPNFKTEDCEDSDYDSKLTMSAISHT
jgi:hypothetical protein